MTVLVSQSDLWKSSCWSELNSDPRGQRHTFTSISSKTHDTEKRGSGHRPRVLVLLASQNGEKWIAEQIQSILEQEDVDVKVVVRDDASRDATRLRIYPFLSANSVYLTGCEIPTGAAAQNYFALMRENAADTFDYVAFSDQDDVWHTNKLSRACQALSAATEAGYSSATVAKWAHGKTKLLTQARRESASHFLFGGNGQGCTFVLTVALFQRVRAFLTDNRCLTTEIHYHDWAVYALAQTWNVPWIYDRAPSVDYRQHGKNDTGARLSITGVRMRLLRIRQGWYGKQLKAIAALCAAADPMNSVVGKWNSILSWPDTWSRRTHIVRFCMLGGRRNFIDNAIVIFAALFGRI